MVLIWFDLSTRDSKVSHVLAHVIRRLRGQSDHLVVFNGSTVVSVSVSVRSGFSSVNFSDPTLALSRR